MLGDKLKVVENGKEYILTSTFCYVKDKPGIYWIDQNNDCWPENMIPRDRTMLYRGSRTNKDLVYTPQENDDFVKGCENNWKRLKEIDTRQKNAGELIYRYVSFPFADGYSVYQVIKINKKTAKLHLVKGIGDDWSIFGEECTVDIATVVSNINHRDRLNDLLKKK